MTLIVGNETDFNSRRRSTTFRNRLIQNVSIPIIDDDIVEAVENFSLSLRIQRQFVNIGVTQGNPATAIGFIIDDDGMHHVCMYTQCCV